MPGRLSDGAVIRPATTADLDAIVRLHADGDHLTVFGDTLNSPALDSLQEQKRELWTSLLSALPAQQQALVVEHEGDVVGFASAGPDPEATAQEGRIFALFVQRDLWGHGLGSLLLSGVEQHLAVVAPDSRLWVVGSNARAQRLYERCGWHFDGTVKRNLGVGWRRYAKSLADPS